MLPHLHRVFTSSAPLKLEQCDRSDFKLYHTVPLLSNGWGLVGEASKWIPVSTARVRSVMTSSEASAPVSLGLTGVPGETIRFGFVHAESSRQQAIRQTGAGAGAVPVHYVTCLFGESGALTMTPFGCID